MSSSTWRVLSGYATYQRTPIRMTSGGKCAPLKLIAIVSLPHDGPLVSEGDHTANGLKGKLATKPIRFPRALQPAIGFVGDGRIPQPPAPAIARPAMHPQLSRNTPR